MINKNMNDDKKSDISPMKNHDVTEYKNKVIDLECEEKIIIDIHVLDDELEESVGDEIVESTKLGQDMPFKGTVRELKCKKSDISSIKNNDVTEYKNEIIDLECEEKIIININVLDDELEESVGDEIVESTKLGLDMPFKGTVRELNGKAYITTPITSTSFICAMCKRRFETLGQLNAHVAKPVPCHVSQYSCPICAKLFESKVKLTAHVSHVHRIGTKFPCPKCNKIFSSSMVLEGHLGLMHTKHFDSVGGRIQCKHCRFICPNLKMIQKHINSKHVSISSYLCDTCGKIFCTKKSFREHTNGYAENRTFMCQFCSKRFKTNQVLTRHLQLHNKSRKLHSCDNCDKVFKKLYSLKLHKNKNKCTQLNRHLPPIL